MLWRIHFLPKLQESILWKNCLWKLPRGNCSVVISFFSSKCSRKLACLIIYNCSCKFLYRRPHTKPPLVVLPLHKDQSLHATWCQLWEKNRIGCSWPALGPWKGVLESPAMKPHVMSKGMTDVFPEISSGHRAWPCTPLMEVNSWVDAGVSN